MKKKSDSFKLVKSFLMICLVLLNIGALNALVWGSFETLGSVPSSDLYDIRSLIDYVQTYNDSVELVVGIAYSTSAHGYSEFASLVAKIGGKVVDTIYIQSKPAAFVVNTPIDSVASFTTDLEATKQFRYIEPNFKYEMLFTPNDPYWVNQWGPKRIEADWAWNTTTGDPSILVAVIDTGIDYDHPDLADNYVALGYDWVNGDSYPSDDNGHGTHCAGIIAAVLNNSEGIAGLAQVGIMAEKALDAGGGGYENDLANAIIHAVDQGADIISMSWGGYIYSALIHDAIKYAYDAGALLVGAAGNDPWPGRHYPAAYKEVIAVTATNQSDEPASFTSYGDWVELAAPGVDIYSTMPTYYVTLNGWPYYKNQRYDYLSGTSMACPHTAGLAALALGQFPTMSRDQLRYYLRYTADDLGEPDFDEYYGYGRINAREAVEEGLPEHDLLLMKWEKPPYVKAGSTMINATVLNFGATTETDVEVELWVNGSLHSTETISSLLSGAIATVTWFWEPQLGNLYNLTVNITAKPGEIDTQNNYDSALIWPETGVIRVPQSFIHIQDAVDAASPGDTIIVEAGVYYEVVCVYKPEISLMGKDRWNTIIDGSGEGWWGFVITADQTYVAKFTVRNTYTGIGLPCSGILLMGSVNNTVTETNVVGNFEGILIWGSSGNTITRNRIVSSEDAGLGVIFGSSNNVISENILRANQQWGIVLILANNNDINNNSIVLTYELDAIGIVLCSQNSITYNYVLSNEGTGYEPSEPYGFAIDISNCGNSVVKNNYVMNNTYGIATGFGNNNNRIYHNNFINNTIQSYVDPSASDMWYNLWEVEGNYWTDYDGEDQTGDGVGNTELPHRGVDNFPLMSQWYTSDINHDGITDISDVVLAAIAYGSQPGDPEWNPHADVNEDGIIDDYDLDLISGEYGLTWATYWNKPLKVLAKDENGTALTTLEVWIDGESVGYTGTSFTILKGPHEVHVQSNYTKETPSGINTYVFSHWEDNSTENPRILTLNSSKTITAYYSFLNLPPSTPSTPSGPLSGYVYTSHTYNTNTTDPESQDILYKFDWNDGTTTTVGPYPSGETANASHQWTRPGTYQVRVRAKDIYGDWSVWSGTLTVSISQNDAGTGGDAGDTYLTPTMIDEGCYKGTLYWSNPTDPQDCYSFYAANGQFMCINMTPPPTADFMLYLNDPDGNYRADTMPEGWGEGVTDWINFTADMSGYWVVQVVIFGQVPQYEGQYTLCVAVSWPPNTPSAPSGITSGYVYTSYSYSTSTTDLDGENVRYEFSWGDGTTTITGWYASGATATASHSWTRPETYQVKVRAQDVYGVWSDWSSTTTVSINQNDANSGGDAGNNFSAATSINTGVTYKGTLYESNPLDTQDWYRFYAQSGQHIYTTMTPPSGVDFDLQLYDPAGNLRASSKKGAGLTDSISFDADSTGYWRISIYIYSGEGQYSFRASVSWPGGCPFLYVYTGKEYVCEGLLDIHDPDGFDVITEHTLITTPKRVRFTYELRLTEHPQTLSHIDQVKLYAILEDKTIIRLPLISAIHSEYGNVLRPLLFSDDWKTETIGADHNNGTSQSITLRFLAPPPNIKIIGFFFVIEGNNRIVKV